MTVRLYYGSESKPEVMVDTTLQEKNITCATDSQMVFKTI